MSTFRNEDVIHNQAQLQNHHGPAFHGPVYNGPVSYVNEMKHPTVAASALEASYNDERIKQSFAFPDMFARRSNVEDPHHNTCHWILNHDRYQEWTAQSSGLLWVKGKPGAGKSTLMAFLFRRLEESIAEDDIRLDFFFSARGSELQKQPLGMIRALLHQLFSQDPSTRKSIRKAYHEKRDSFGVDYDKSAWSWQRKELEVLFSKLVQQSAKQHRVQLFVDALDEAGGQNAREVAAFFHRINDAIIACGEGRLKICISCRHYPVPATRPGSEIHVEDHNGNDILQYIKDRFVFDQPALNDRHDEEVWNQLRSNITNRAAGVFQWVVLVINLVETYVAEGYSPEEIQARVRKVPQALSDLYDYIVRHVIEHENRPTSLLLFQWVCFATRPLLVEEMRYALVSNDITTSPNLIKCHQVPHFVRNAQRMKSRLNSLSGGLVEIVKSDDHHGPDPPNVVQVIHQSVRDFLFSFGLELIADLARSDSTAEIEHQQLKTKTQFSAKCHAVLYQSCWNYLTIEGPSILDMTADPSGTDEKMSQGKFPLLGYATDSLMLHARDSNILSGSRKDVHVNSLQDILIQWTQYHSRVAIWSNMSVPRLNLGASSKGTTLLHVAASLDWIQLVTYLLDSGVDIDSTNDQNRTALHCAVLDGCRRTAQFLVDSGANVDTPDVFDMTPLHITARHGRWDLANMLLDRGANVEPSGTLDSTPLSYAALHGDATMVKRLIAAGAKVNVEPGRQSPLYEACKYASLEVIRILLQAGADPNSHHLGNRMPLARAARYNNSEAVKCLLEVGVDIHGREGTTTALQQASNAHAHDVVSLLISCGADVNAPAGYTGGVLHAAARHHGEPGEIKPWSYHGSMAMFKQLLAAGADINAFGGEFDTALAAASYSGDSDLVSMFLDAGADLNAGLSRGSSPLFVAVVEGHTDIAKRLIELGADFQTPDSTGYSVLHVNAYAGNGELLNILKQKGMNLDALDMLGRTPLHMALISRQYEHASALISHGADCSITDAFGRTPLDYIYTSKEIPEHLSLLLRDHQPNWTGLDVSAVQNYLIALVGSMQLKNLLRTTALKYYDFVHCLSQISNSSLTRPFSKMVSFLDGFHITCTLCSRDVGFGWWICQQCPFFDLCQFCLRDNPAGMRPKFCCNHELCDQRLSSTADDPLPDFHWFGIFEDNPDGWWLDDNLI